MAGINSQLRAAAELRDTVAVLSFSQPVTHVYNPLDYAWNAFSAYVERFGNGPKRAVFLGMNPGPWGMAQTGVPFGEIAAVKEWMKLSVTTGRPKNEHPSYPVTGLSCRRSEVSGKRLWGLMKSRFGSAEAFFSKYFVVNYCPLLFIGQGHNITPDKIKAADRKPLYDACDKHLRAVTETLTPQWVIGIGGFAEARAREALTGIDVKIARILHPSPASPLSNKDWPGTVTSQLTELGIWEE